MAQVASKVCEICDGGGHGKYHCQECDQLFCENCKMIHTRTRMSKNHTYLTVSNTNLENNFFPNNRISVTKVNRNSMTDPSESTKNKLEELQTESLMNIEEKVAKAKSCISQMDNNRKSYRENIKKVINTITEDGDHLKKLVDQRIDELKKMIRDKEEKEIEKMVTYNKGCRAVLQKFQSLEKDIKDVVATTDVHIQLLQKMKQFNADVDSIELQDVPDEPSASYTNKKLSGTDIDTLHALFGELQFPKAPSTQRAVKNQKETRDISSAQRAIVDNQNETSPPAVQKKYRYMCRNCGNEQLSTKTPVQGDSYGDQGVKLVCNDRGCIGRFSDKKLSWHDLNRIEPIH